MYLIDANVFLELLLQQKKVNHCQTFLEKVKNGEEEGVITDLLVDAIILVMEKYRINAEGIATFISSLSAYKGLRVYFLSLPDRLLATLHMEEFGLDFDHATSYQAMKRMKIHLISFDNHFDVVKGVKRIQPDKI